MLSARTARRARGAVSAALCALVVACVPTPDGGTSTTTTSSSSTTTTTTTIPEGGSSDVAVLVTTGDRSRLLAAGSPLRWVSDASSSLPTIEVDPSTSFQTFDGVGAALTDSSATLLVQRLSASARSALLRDLFGPGGARLSYVRVPLTASDFSVTDYTFDDLPTGSTDPGLDRFSIAHDEVATLPLLREIRSVNPATGFMGSPWTAPGWMKTGTASGRNGLVGGTLSSTWTSTYARYLRRVVEAYAAAGARLDTLTLQNEPGYSPSDYPGMTLSATAEAGLAAATGQQLASVPAPPKLLVHDHNWDTASRAAAVLADPAAKPYVAGAAFHCYGGDPAAQSTVHDQAPGKDVYFTECTGTFSSGDFASNLLWNVDNLVIGATRNWARTVLLWNVALDPSGGPHRGGCGDCRGVVTVDSDGSVTRNEEYYALAHLGRAAVPGAQRIRSTELASGVRSVAFLNPDQSVGLVLTNDGPAVTVKVREGSRSFTTQLPARSVSTFSWS